MESNIEQPTDWVARDRACVWHPFTQEKHAALPIPITHAYGARLFGADGKSYIDGISSWWANLHGHCHPHIAASIAKQATRLEHVMFAGFTHPPAVELAEKLLALLPSSYSRVFFSDNGSTAIETALKMVFQYWFNQGNHKKRRIISFENAYHGDTFGAMSVAGKTGYNTAFWPWMFEVISIPPPLVGEEHKSLALLDEYLKDSETVAAFIFEPVIQGSAGMVIHNASALGEMIEKCKQAQVLTIADEVMTGFGRTGPNFAQEHANIFADVICLSKGITGGFMPLAVTMCTEEIYKAFWHDEKEKALLHGHTYTANPLACAAALASLELLQSDECAQQRNAINEAHRNFQDTIKSHPKITRCEVLGTIFVMEITSPATNYFNPIADDLKKFFISNGVLLRPLGNVLYVMPPYCITHEELHKIYDLIFQSLDIS